MEGFGCKSKMYPINMYIHVHVHGLNIDKLYVGKLFASVFICPLCPCCQMANLKLGKFLCLKWTQLCLGDSKTGRNRLQVRKGEYNRWHKNNPVYNMLSLDYFLITFTSIRPCRLLLTIFINNSSLNGNFEPLYTCSSLPWCTIQI